MRPLIIGLCGYGRVGKSTTAAGIKAHLKVAHDQPVVVLPFAAPIKDLARNYFGWDGTKDERGRRLLQTLGTEVGRAWDPQIWIKKWQETATAMLDSGVAIIADDLRFDNEEEVIRNLGGYVVRLSHATRGAEAKNFSHASEEPDKINCDLWVEMGTKSPIELAKEIIRYRL